VSWIKFKPGTFQEVNLLNEYTFEIGIKADSWKISIQTYFWIDGVTTDRV
jgi:hypothetical protein